MTETLIPQSRIDPNARIVPCPVASENVNSVTGVLSMWAQKKQTFTVLHPEIIKKVTGSDESSLTERQKQYLKTVRQDYSFNFDGATGPLIATRNS